MRQIGFNIDNSGGASIDGVLPPGREAPSPPARLDSVKFRIGSDEGGGASLTLPEGLGLHQAAVWLAEAGARAPQLLKLLQDIASNAVTIASHVPPDFADGGRGARPGNWELILSETADGEVMLYPNEDSQIRLAVWDFGLATAQDASALNRLGKLLNSASTLAELIASQE